MTIRLDHFFASVFLTNSSITQSVCWYPNMPLSRMTPSWSITKNVGQARTFHLLEIGPLLPPSQKERQVIFSSSRIFLSASRS